MPGLDTNVLVRWLVDDDRRQSAAVQKLFETARANDALLFVPDTVMLELEWVLRSCYEFDKATIIRTFNALLEAQELAFQTEGAIEQALLLYRQSSADFADCLHVALCGTADQAPMLSFDGKAARLPGASRLPT